MWAYSSYKIKTYNNTTFLYEPTNSSHNLQLIYKTCKLILLACNFIYQTHAYKFSMHPDEVENEDTGWLFYTAPPSIFSTGIKFRPSDWQWPPLLHKNSKCRDSTQGESEYFSLLTKFRVMFRWSEQNLKSCGDSPHKIQKKIFGILSVGIPTTVYFAPWAISSNIYICICKPGQFDMFHIVTRLQNMDSCPLSTMLWKRTLIKAFRNNLDCKPCSIRLLASQDKLDRFVNKKVNTLWYCQF